MLKEKDLETVKQAMVESEIDNESIEKVITKLTPEQIEEIAKAEKQKKNMVIVISDPEGKISGDFTGWVLQAPEEVGILEIMDKAKMAMYDYNASRKGSKQPVNSLGEGFEGVPYRFFKEHKIGVKTKEPVYVLTTDNILPKDSNE